MAEGHAARVKAEFERLHQRSAAAVRLLPHSPSDLQLRMERLAAELRTPMPKIVQQAMRKTAPPASEPSRGSRGGRGSNHGRASRGGRARATRGRGGQAKKATARSGSDTDESDTERPQSPEARRAGSASRASSAPSIKAERCASCGDTLERRAIGGCCSVDCWRKMRQDSPKALPEVTPKASRASSHSSVQTLNGRKRKNTESRSSTVSNTESARCRPDAKGRRLLTATEEARCPKAAKRPMLNRTERDASASTLQPATVKAKWLDLPLGLLQWGFTEQLHCRQRSGQWTISAGSPNITSPICVSGPAAHRWLRTAATQGALTQIGAVERRIAAAAKVERDEFHGPLPFLPRTVRRRLRLMSVTSPKQSKIAQQSKAQRHADRLAAAEIREANALHRDRSMPGLAPKSRGVHACSSSPFSIDSIANPTAHQQHRPELHLPQQLGEEVQKTVDAVLQPNTLQKSNQDRNQAVSAIRTRHDADTRGDRAAYRDNERDTSNEKLIEKPPRSALWQRTTRLSTSLRPVEAYSQEPGRTLSSSTTGAQSWLDNRRPQLVAPAAAAPAPAALAAPATTTAPSGLRTAHLAAAIGGQTFAVPSVSTVASEEAAGEKTFSDPVASVGEASAESSFDFGDTLDGGLQLSTGGLGLTSVVALIAPRSAGAAGAAGAAGKGWGALANPHRTHTSHATAPTPAVVGHLDANWDDGSLVHVLPAPLTEYC